MKHTEYKDISSKTLRELQERLGLNNVEMAELIGISYKTWLNRISADSESSRKLLSKLEYEHLLYLAEKKDKAKI